MAKKTPTWLIGCGIGCGAIVLLGLALLGLGALWTRSAVKGFDEAVTTRAELEEKLGRPEEFTPLPDGSVPADRMEAFLAVREAMQPIRSKMSEAFKKMPLSNREARELEEKPFNEKLGRIFEIAGSAMGMPGQLGAFLNTRNRALVDTGMSMGEYAYIYTLSYYNLLGHPPGDGPEGPGRVPRRGSVRVMGATASNDVQDYLGKILTNQLAALPPDAPEELRERLSSEVDALAADHDRMPWQDGLPEQIRASLEPYADRLEATYSRYTNGMELSRVRKGSAISFADD